MAKLLALFLLPRVLELALGDRAEVAFAFLTLGLREAGHVPPLDLLRALEDALLLLQQQGGVPRLVRRLATMPLCDLSREFLLLTRRRDLLRLPLPLLPN